MRVGVAFGGRQTPKRSPAQLFSPSHFPSFGFPRNREEREMEDVARVVVAVEAVEVAEEVLHFLDRSGRARVVIVSFWAPLEAGGVEATQSVQGEPG